MTYKSEFLNILQSRGFIHQGTDLVALDALAHKNEVVAYVGYDCTADSLHVGHLLSIMMLHWLQKTGNKPIALMGGGTTKVGDPSGRDESRQLLTDEVIAANMASIKRVFGNYLKFGDGKQDAIMVNNADWLDKLEYIPFLRDVGRHFSINRMLTMDSVKLRLEREQPLSFLEFNYMILQGYDFVELQRRYGCNLQMGGSDQWGNIISGVDLARRISQRDVFGLTCPLLTTSSGAKMGKTASGAVWLNAERLQPYDFWQYWRNTEDADVGKFLRLFTELPMDEIARLEKAQGGELNDVKKILATEVTKLCHGADAASHAAETARKVFEEGGIGGDIPKIEIQSDSLADALVQLQFAASKSEARRLIKSNSVKVNDKPIDNELYNFSAQDFGGGNGAKVSAGKKKIGLVLKS
ncbi:MAG: tyrosine--tRNA ligase [Alphaproteobacteria bacterium]|nr:MAG: tyrosine--tRNA ligase [Alphaproteobacteria bacterium]